MVSVAPDWVRFFQIPTREPSGRRQREKVQEVIYVAARNRERMGVHPDEVRSQLAGSILGRLRLQDEITPEQYSSGQRFGRLAHRYAALMGIPMRNPKSASLALIGGQSVAAEPTEAEIMETRREYENAYCVIMDDRDGRKFMEALKTCVIADQPADLGDLRCGLNLLSHMWRR